MALVLGSLLVSVVVWLLVKLLFLELPSFRTHFLLRKIHGPSRIPIFGAVLDYILMPSEGIFDYMKDLLGSYPKLTFQYLAGVPCVIVQKAPDLQVILMSNANIKKGFEYATLIPWLNEGLLTSYGTKWHTRRKLLTPTFHFKILEDALVGMRQNTEILAEKLSETNGESVPVDDYITRCTLDVMGDAAMGVRLEAQSSKGQQYLDTVKETAEMIIKRILSVYQMKDWIFALSRNGWFFRKNLKILHTFTDNVIAERKVATDLNSKAEDAFGCKRRKAFLDCLLEMQTSNPGVFSDKDIREEVDTFMFEGFDTTSTALCFGLWLIGSHPDVQDRVYEEIMTVVGDDEITMKNVQNMNYLERVIKETLRLYPSVPYISRKLSDDVGLEDGTILPATTNIIILPVLIHRDPEYFPDPERFDPDRFTEEASKNRHPFAYIPFSAGPRNCIGQKFAMLEMKITLASVVRKLRIESVTKKSDFNLLPHVMLRPTIPLKCTFIPR